MTGSFIVSDTAIEGLKVIERMPRLDERGHFERFYCATELGIAGLNKPVRQMNRSLTLKQGTVRGLHYQRPPYAESKLVSCLSGRVLDVAVDLRRNSPTFLHWHAEELAADNNRALFIPEGFAHGFQTLVPNCVMFYLHTADHVRESEAGINIDDDKLAIRWPLPIAQISDRDAALPRIDAGWEGIQP